MNRRTDRKATPAATAGLLALAAGLIAWAWTGDWRWAATGAGLLLALAALGAHLDRPR